MGRRPGNDHIDEGSGIGKGQENDLRDQHCTPNCSRSDTDAIKLRNSIPCGNGEEGASLGHFKVQGVTAHMYGFCGTGTPYSCGSTNIALWLMWKKGKNYYIAASHDQTRANLLLFARTLRKV